MTAPKFMNVVRFKLKPECVDQYFEVHGKLFAKVCPTDTLHKQEKIVIAL